MDLFFLHLELKLEVVWVNDTSMNTYNTKQKCHLRKGEHMHEIAKWSHEMRLSLHLVEFPKPDFGEMYLFFQGEMLPKRASEKNLPGGKLLPT